MRVLQQNRPAKKLSTKLFGIMSNIKWILIKCLNQFGTGRGKEEKGADIGLRMLYTKILQI